MLRLALIFTFMVTTLFSWTFAEEDKIKSAIEDLTKGARLSQNLTDHLRTAAKNIENSMEKAERGMLDLTEKINSLGLNADNLTSAFAEYDNMKMSLRLAERKLRTLMNNTRTAAAKLLDNFRTWDNFVDVEDDYRKVKEQV